MATRCAVKTLACVLFAFLPVGLARVSLFCKSSTEHLGVSWTNDFKANHYELQVGVPGRSDAFAGYYLDGNQTHKVMEKLLPGRRYWFQLLATTDTDIPSRIWTPISAKQECQTPPELDATDDVAIAASSPRRRGSLYPRRRGFFVLEAIRSHDHYESNPYNRNAANAKAEVWVLNKRHAKGKIGKNCVMELYTIHVKKLDFTGQTTPKGDNSQHYANYMSCNSKGGTSCSVSCPDNYRCAQIGDADCHILGVWDHCHKARDDSISQDHVGMGCVEEITTSTSSGRWFSFPEKGHKAGNWKWDTEVLKAACPKLPTTEDVLEKIFAQTAKAHLRNVEVDEPAFSVGGNKTVFTSFVV